MHCPPTSTKQYLDLTSGWRYKTILDRSACFYAGHGFPLIKKPNTHEINKYFLW